jgi:hypothetical protein
MDLFELIPHKCWRFVPTINRGDIFSEEALLEYGLTPNKTYHSLEIKYGVEKNFILILNDRKEIKAFSIYWFKSINDDRDYKLNQLLK